MIWYDHFIAKGGAEQVSLELAKQLEIRVETIWADKALFSSYADQCYLKSHNYDFQSTVFPTWSLIKFYRSFRPVSDTPYWLLTGVFAPLMMVKKPKNKMGVIYFHTFPSFINESYFELKKRNGMAGALIFKFVCKLYVRWLRKAIISSDKIFVNSRSVGKRFEKYLGVKVEVLYPPVSLDDLDNKGNKGYFLSSARLEENKRVDLILEAFKERPSLTLLVAGGGTLEDELQSKYSACKNIHFLGWQSKTQMNELYSYCNSLIYLPKNEYFGIAPVQALAAGKPVISVAEGGILETMSDPRCGYLLNSNFNLTDLCIVLDSFSFNEKYSEFRQQHARQFGSELFYHSLKKVLQVSES